MLRITAIASCALLATSADAAQVVIEGPVGSGEFGTSVTILPNGNIVVTDPGYDAPGPIVDVGAVYLFRPDGSLISSLTGSSANDGVGIGITVLTNGNYVVLSGRWNNGAIPGVGAATFATGTSGIAGEVSPDNSLIGSSAYDGVGSVVRALANGNYLVQSATWNNAEAADAGAATFGSGISGVSGVVSASNSLVGSTAGDRIGQSVFLLTNGSYVVRSPYWDSSSIVNAGAVTFGSGVSGISGPVSPAISLVGTKPNEQLGDSFITALSNGNYVVPHPKWDNGSFLAAGAATFGSGTTGVSGVISQTNSLVGSSSNDQVGSSVYALANGNYVVVCNGWDNGIVANVGAVTFGSGSSGISGVVEPANSLIGSSAGDSIGSSVTALANGNYVVQSSVYDNGEFFNAGAVTFADGTDGLIGVVSPANSLIGTGHHDNIGSTGVTALSNGNYVVRSAKWDDGAVMDVGAVTFGSGTTGTTGIVSAANSLVGSTAFDSVGGAAVTPLANGNYVIQSTLWDHGAVVDAGATTFGSGTSGISGVISPSNSLVGSSEGDMLLSFGVIALQGGDYVVSSKYWDNGAIVDAGAATFGSGSAGVTGEISSANSLVGTTPFDQVGYGGITPLSDGSYVVRSPLWNMSMGAATFGTATTGIVGVISAANSLVGSTSGDLVGLGGGAFANGNYFVRSTSWNNGLIAGAGAITLGLSDASVTGTITDTHSVLGSVAGGGALLASSYDTYRNQLAVGQPASNRVVLHRTGAATSTSMVAGTPDPSISGQPVIFTATVSATPGAPTNGQVTFTASSGESCIDTTPSATSATTAEFSCTMALVAIGTSTVIAEYTGSVIHAYSGSAPETHTTIADVMFGNGFESP